MTVDLTTYYGRLKLKSPLVVGACPMTGDEQMRLAMEAAGAAAIVMPSLFQEQVILWNKKNGTSLNEAEQRVLERSTRSHVESFCDDADTYLSVVNRACVLSSIPIIASLNGEVDGKWLDFAGELQETGASAIELNIKLSPPSEFESPRELEDKIVELVCTIGQSVTVPVYVKLSKEFTSLSHLSRRLLSGAQGLVLFARSPDVDICLDSLKLKTTWELTPSGSVSHLLHSVMRIHSYCPAMPLAVCGGIGNASHALKALLAGADVAMVTSAIYREGPGVIETMIDGIEHFMEQRGWKTIADLYAARPLEFTTEDERLDYVRSLASRPKRNPNEETDRAPMAPQSGDRWGHPRTTL